MLLLALAGSASVSTSISIEVHQDGGVGGCCRGSCPSAVTLEVTAAEVAVEVDDAGAARWVLRECQPIASLVDGDAGSQYITNTQANWKAGGDPFCADGEVFVRNAQSCKARRDTSHPPTCLPFSGAQPRAPKLSLSPLPKRPPRNRADARCKRIRPSAAWRRLAPRCGREFGRGRVEGDGQFRVLLPGRHVRRHPLPHIRRGRFGHSIARWGGSRPSACARAQDVVR